MCDFFCLELFAHGGLGGYCEWKMWENFVGGDQQLALALDALRTSHPPQDPPDDPWRSPTDRWNWYGTLVGDVSVSIVSRRRLGWHRLGGGGIFIVSAVLFFCCVIMLLLVHQCFGLCPDKDLTWPADCRQAMIADKRGQNCYDGEDGYARRGVVKKWRLWVRLPKRAIMCAILSGSPRRCCVFFTVVSNLISPSLDIVGILLTIQVPIAHAREVEEVFDNISSQAAAWGVGRLLPV